MTAITTRPTEPVTPPVVPGNGGDTVMTVSVHQIVANRQQPRRVFNDERIDELSASIKENGVLQPLLVTPSAGAADRYELVAGERRLRAARKAGLDKVPVVVRHNVTAEEQLELAIVENLQREDLNPIEEALALQSMVDQFSYSHEEMAKKLGKSRSYVTNSVRLLQLPKVVQDDLVQGRMDTGHARALLALANLQEQLTVREQILHSQLTVRDVEKMVQARVGTRADTVARRDGKSREEYLTPQLRFITEEMTKSCGTKVELKPKSAKSGFVEIEYYSLQDLDRIYRKLTTVPAARSSS